MVDRHDKITRVAYAYTFTVTVYEPSAKMTQTGAAEVIIPIESEDRARRTLHSRFFGRCQDMKLLSVEQRLYYMSPEKFYADAKYEPIGKDSGGRR